MPVSDHHDIKRLRKLRDIQLKLEEALDEAEVYLKSRASHRSIPDQEILQYAEKISYYTAPSVASTFTPIPQDVHIKQSRLFDQDVQKQVPMAVKEETQVRKEGGKKETQIKLNFGMSAPIANAASSSELLDLDF